jgi:hypothetical protein
MTTAENMYLVEITKIGWSKFESELGENKANSMTRQILSAVIRKAKHAAS